MIRGLLANLRAGARLAMFLPVRDDQLAVNPDQLIALTLFALLVAFGVDFAAAGPHGQFNPWGLPGALFPIPLWLLSGYLAARLARERSLSLAVPIAILSIDPFLHAYGLLLTLAASAQWLDLSKRPLDLLYSWSAFAWWGAAGCAAVLRLANTSAWRRLLAVSSFAALAIVPAAGLPRASIGALWIESYDERGRDDESTVVTEKALYAQPDLLRRRLAALAPGRAGSQDLYFVGVAGYASEDVFGHEVLVIRDLFERRFGAAGRSVVLVNNPDTALQEPVATLTSLERTLKRIGQLMKRDQDVLFLYLTSHGSEDHRFAIELPPLRLRDLDPQALKQMLDAAGIQWRVVVVSACYSGGFIAPLRDEHTLVITAADPVHTSFGCGAESDFTYFGKAYFDEALRKTYSFTQAFERARRSIETREKAESLTPSNPQIFVGALMQEKLRQLEASWKARESGGRAQ